MTELTVDVAFKTDVGQARQHNEDFVDLYEPVLPASLDSIGRLYVVADGVGGGAKGEVASAYAVTKVLHMYYHATRPDLAERLREAVQVANADLFEHSEAHPEIGRMGTTLVAALVHHDTLTVANVGDSRAYLIRSNEINQITRDHSLVAQMVEAGVITAEEAESHPQRNVVLRSLGADTKVQVDIFAGSLQPGDRIVLCSDGLTGYVADQEIMDLASRGSARQAVKELVHLANDRGGGDNITVLILHVTAATTLEALAGTIRQAKLPALPDLETLVNAPPVPSTTPALRKPVPDRRHVSLPLILGAIGVLLIAALFTVGVLASRLLPFGEREQAPAVTPSVTATTPTAATADSTEAAQVEAGTPSAPADAEETVAVPTATLIPQTSAPRIVSEPSCPAPLYQVPTGKGLLDVSTATGANTWCLMWTNGIENAEITPPVLRICDVCRSPGRLILAREIEADNTTRLYAVDFASGSVGFIVNPSAYQPVSWAEGTYGGLTPGCCPASAGKIVFSEGEGAASQLWMATEGGADRRPLGAPQLVGMQPALSPDGSRVAFVRLQAGEPQLILASVDGQGEWPLGMGRQPAWSPDGAWLAFVKPNANDVAEDIWKVAVGPTGAVSDPVSVSGGEGFRLQPAWSPDGTRLAYVQAPARPEPGSPAFGSLWIAAAEGGEAPFELVGSDVSNPVWAPSGGFIAFSRQVGDAVDLWAVGVENDPQPGLILENSERDWLLSWQ